MRSRLSAPRQALRDADRRLDALGQSQLQVATAVDGKLNKATRRMQQDSERLRQETHDLLAELEQLTLQTYEEHEAAIAQQRETFAETRAAFETTRDTQQATLEAQQAQIDALGAALRRQQGMLDEQAQSYGMQMAAVQAEIGELNRGFSAQAAALQQTKAYAESMEEKLSAQIEQRISTSELLTAATIEAVDGKAEQHARTLASVMEEHAKQQDKYEQLLQWRVGVDGGLANVGARADGLEASLELARSEARDGLRGARDELRDAAAQWPEWAAAIEEAVRKLQAGKADSAAVDDACGALSERLEAVARQLAPLPGAVGSCSSSVQQLGARLDAAEPRAEKQASLLAEQQAAAQRLAAELLETRGHAKAQAQQLGALVAEERAHGTALAAQETRLKHVGGMAEEHSRYLAQIGESLFAQKAVGYRFRTAAVVPSFAPAPQPSEQSHVPGSPEAHQRLLDAAASHMLSASTAATAARAPPTTEPRAPFPRDDAAHAEWLASRPTLGGTPSQLGVGSPAAARTQPRPSPALGPG